MQVNRAYEMIVTLRTHALSDVEAFALSLAILVWAKHSARKELPTDCCIDSALASADPKSVLARLIAHSAETRSDGLFAELAKLRELNVGVVKSLLLCARDLATGGLLDRFSADALLPRSNPSPLVLPTELASLIVTLGCLDPGESIYAPWDFYSQLALEALAKSGTTLIETPIRSSVPLLIAALADASVEVRYADPIVEPSVSDRAQLPKFDVALAFPPIGLRYEKSAIHADRLQRFPEQTTSGCVLAIRHLLALTRRRIVIGVPNSLLSNSGAERLLRQDILARGLVETVISLPAGLFATTMVATAVLVLDPRGGHRQVQFVNTDGSQYSESVTKARSKLTKLDQLCEIALSHHKQQAEDIATAVVPVDEVLANDATLQVNRYVVPPATRALATRLASERTAPLGKFVQTVRPLPPTITKDVPSLEAAAVIREVGVADLPAHGYIQSAAREISIDAGTFRMAAPLFLQPLDIVLIVKGSVGRVGIVPTSAPPLGPEGWIVGQSGIVLRVSDTQSIDPRVLFMQLRSEMGQEQLRGIVAGSTTPLIQLRELLMLPVVLPSASKCVEVIDALEIECRIQEQIDKLLAEQEKAAAHLWSLG